MPNRLAVWTIERVCFARGSLRIAVGIGGIIRIQNLPVLNVKLLPPKNHPTLSDVNEFLLVRLDDLFVIRVCIVSLYQSSGISTVLSHQLKD